MGDRRVSRPGGAVVGLERRQGASVVLLIPQRQHHVGAAQQIGGGQLVASSGGRATTAAGDVAGDRDNRVSEGVSGVASGGRASDERNQTGGEHGSSKWVHDVVPRPGSSARSRKVRGRLQLDRRRSDLFARAARLATTNARHAAGVALPSIYVDAANATRQAGCSVTGTSQLAVVGR
jgi:hypothetical protein